MCRKGTFLTKTPRFLLLYLVLEAQELLHVKRQEKALKEVLAKTKRALEMGEEEVGGLMTNVEVSTTKKCFFFSAKAAFPWLRPFPRTSA